jgi:hypothetical protein
MMKSDALLLQTWSRIESKRTEKRVNSCLAALENSFFFFPVLETKPCAC